LFNIITFWKNLHACMLSVPDIVVYITLFD
jgi:hypothetical protein